jgi:Tfp pilus assembly protein PilF
VTNHQACQLAWQKLADGQNDRARELFAEVLLGDANYASALHGMGYLAWIGGRLDEAIELLTRASRSDPRRADVYLHLAAAYEQAKQVPRAIEALQRAIQIDPKQARYHAALAVGLGFMQRLPEALASYRRALALEPRNVDMLIGASTVLRTMDQLDEAESLARQALAIDPANTPAHSTLAAVLQLQGDLEGAESECRAALARDSANADLHSALWDVLLTRGKLREGFAEYEWRFEAKGDPVVIPTISSPRWDGAQILGQTLLVQCEQGLGDTIQFARLLPLAAKQCGKLLFRCQPTLVELLQRADFGANVEMIPDAQGMPPHDCHLALLSLPHVLGITLETIPSSVPYLAAHSDRVERAGALLPARQKEGELRVGLAWKGSPTHRLDSVRSMDPTALAPLREVAGVRWVSLQKGQRGAPPPVPLVDITEELNDFSDTAGLITQLDLVLSVDTSVAHLAGALAKPVWVMLSTRTDCRWMWDRTDSPWYPTMRLFRQKRLRDWSNVLDDVCRALAEFKSC